MSLRAKLDSKLAGAWVKLQDIPVPSVLKEVTAETYDPATSEAVSTYVDHNVDVVLSRLTEVQVQELTGGLGEYEALVRLAQISVVPKEGDIFEIDGESYRVIGAPAGQSSFSSVDPARVLWTGYLSKRGGIDNGLAG